MSDEDGKEKELANRHINCKLKYDTKELLTKLTAREAKVLRRRFVIDSETEQSLEEVGEHFNVTRQRIREIEENALRKLRAIGPEDDYPNAA